MPDPTFKIDGATVLSKSGTTVSVDSGLNIKPAINASGTTPIYACRAWVNFDGTDTSSANPLNFSNDNAENEGGANSAGENLCAIRGSGNVSKVVRNGTGDYTVYFTTAMPDTNYADIITLSDVADNIQAIRKTVHSPTTTSRRFECFWGYGSRDNETVTFAVFR